MHKIYKLNLKLSIDYAEEQKWYTQRGGEGERKGEG